MSHPILIARGLELGYEDEPSILTDLNFELFPHDFIGLSGPNGAGKTTFVRALLGLITPRSGSITYYTPEGRQIEELNIGYMPQQNRLDKAFPISVEEVVVSGLFNHKMLRSTKEQKTKARNALRQVGMLEIAKRPLGALSGGQLQRVLLARAIVSEPSILILDEPTTYVDRSFEEVLHQMLPTLQQHTALIMVSHNLEHLRELSTRLYHIDHEFIRI